MWEAGQALYDIPQHRYDSRVLPIGSDLPEAGGVYLFAHWYPWDPQIIYIGMTDNFRRELYFELERLPCLAQLRAMGATDVMVLKIVDPAERRHVFDGLRMHYDPMLNRAA